MNLTSTDEMFILAIVALFIVGAIALELIKILRECVCYKCDKKEKPKDDEGTDEKLKDTSLNNQITNQDIMKKLDDMDKESEFPTYITIASLAFAFFIYSFALIVPIIQNLLQGIAGVILSLIIFAFADKKVRLWKRINERHARFILWFILGFVIVLMILSIKFPIALIVKPS